ncbi:MAG: hypothetical protein ACKVP0_26370 [Pirellulaceae bacterium]
MSEAAPRFAYYEKVRVDSRVSKNECVNGEIGAVLGRVQMENETWYYAVHIYSTANTWCFFEHELLPTGEQALREDFYDGSFVHVRVDEKGRGYIVPDAE